LSVRRQTRQKSHRRLSRHRQEFRPAGLRWQRRRQRRVDALSEGDSELPLLVEDRRRFLAPLLVRYGQSRRPRAALLVGRAVDDLRSAHGSRHRSEEHTSELQSRGHLVCRLLLEKKNEIELVTLMSQKSTRSDTV